MLVFLVVVVNGSAWNALDSEASPISCETPKVTLEAGTVGSSTIYANGTSALASVTAPAPTPTYYPNSYNIQTGSYVSGTIPTSVQTVDSDYFIVKSASSATSTTAYNPSGYNLIGSTTLVSGTTADLASDNSAYMTFRSYASATSAQTLYSHQETTTIGGTSYYFQRLSSADAAGTTLSADAGTTGRKLMGKFVYQLTGVSTVSASTWTIYYRAYKSHTNLGATADVDILVRMSNGTVRSTIATQVAVSGALTTSWSTLSGSYSWTAYTVVAQTDYLEIDRYINVTTAKASQFVYSRIDDNTLPVADQSRVSNILLPSEFTSEVEFTGSSNAQPWYQLVWNVDSAWTAGSVAVTIQAYNYTLGDYSPSGNGYDSYTSSATNGTDETRTQTVTANPTQFRDVSGNWKIKVKGVKSTTTQFDFKADWIEFKPSYYSEYTASTEFLFSSLTKNTPTQLNFTTVSEHDVANVSVTLQVWNYSSSSYATSGEGYLAYTSTSPNETKLLSINASPQNFTSSGSAKVKVTSVLATTAQYQQKANQVKLLYSYDSSSSYDYVLKIVNHVPDAWNISLRVYSNANITRLSNMTVSFHDGTMSEQIIITGGSVTQSEGALYDLAGSSTVYVSISNLQATAAEVSYLYVYLKIQTPDTTTYNLLIVVFEIT